MKHELKDRPPRFWPFQKNYDREEDMLTDIAEMEETEQVKETMSRLIEVSNYHSLLLGDRLP